MSLNPGLRSRALAAQGVTISNDGATLMKLLDVVHPAAKILVDISTSQDAEVLILHARWELNVAEVLLMYSVQ